MRRSRVRKQVAALIILLPAAAGVLAVHASPTCQRLVRTYVTQPIRNRVSPRTAEAWAIWRTGHPNWKPNPNLHRPKYVMTREEAVEKLAFACSIPVNPTNSDALFPFASVNPPPPIINFTPMEATQITLPDAIPPEVAEITPGDSGPPLGSFVPPILGSAPNPQGGVPGLPIVPPPDNPPTTGPVPEPPSLLLLVSGILCLFLLPDAKIRLTNTIVP